MNKKLSSLLIKPAGPDCNLACDYCFYLGKSEQFPSTESHRISDEMLENLIKQAMQQAGEEISFVWQGGEPTLMGLPFFERVVELQQKYGKNQMVGNALQTNGLLIDEKWAAFLKKYAFLVGLSIDGTKDIHDHYRKSVGGKGSWDAAVSALAEMQKAEVAVNALSVINDYSANFPTEIYNSHKQLGLTFMQFIPCLEKDENGKLLSYSLSPEKYGEFMSAIFDLWIADFRDGEPTTSVRLFESLFYRYVGRTPPQCTLMEECGTYLVVEHNGDVYACDFYVDPDHRLGNIESDKLVEMMNSDQQTEFGCQKAALPKKCQQCQWLKYCRGGCPRDRDEQLNQFCDGLQAIFQHIDKKMRILADRWRRQNSRI
jgi:uncharacterized protein